MKRAIANSFNKLSEWLRALPESRLLFILALVTGLLSGLAAVSLKHLAHLISWLLRGWMHSSGESILYLIYPGVGMFLTMLLIRFFIKDDIGHGVTKVLLAISKNESRIKRHNTWSSVVASSLTIGFGGSVGAEAPIVYTGAAIGSNIANRLGLSYKHITILLGCGAAGAVAGIFKAPLAGILFTLEILLFNISMTSILPLLVSTVTATIVSFLLLGDAVVFSSTIENFNLSEIPFYIILGLLCGLFSLYFTRATLWLESRIKKIEGPYRRWIISASLLGVLIFLFPPLFGEGYGSLTAILNKDIDSAIGPNIYGSLLNSEWFILLFFIAIVFFKVMAMSFTNAGGGVGGTFGPTLFIGGVLGFVVSRFINLSGIGVLPESNFALAGMAGLMAGVMQAPLTAIFLNAEISGGYTLLLPLIITCITSFFTIRNFEPYSIYTKRIAASGDLITHDSDKAVLTLMKIGDVLEKDFQTVDISGNLGDIVTIISTSKRNLIPVVDKSGKYFGIVHLDNIREIMFEKEQYQIISVESLMSESPVVVLIDDKMDCVMNKFEDSGEWNLPVLSSEGNYLGFVSKSQIFSAYRDQLQQVSHE